MVIIQCVVILGISLFAGCDSGNLVSYTSGPDGKTVRADYSFVYREMMIVSDGQLGIDFVADQQEKKCVPLVRELGALPPSDLYSKAEVTIRWINLTSEPIDIEILSYKKPNGELLTKVSELTIPPEGAHVVNFGEIIVGTYRTGIRGVVVEYNFQGIKYASSFNPKRLTFPQWDEYYYAPDRIKAMTAAELFRKTYTGK